MMSSVQEDKNTEYPFDVQRLIRLFEEKGKYLKVLLGDYGNIQFLDQLKKEIPLDEPEWEFLNDNPLTPYLIEYQIATTISLFRLWMSKENNLASEEIFNLIHRLHTEGITSILRDL